ncbi:hypothetical protein OROMI_012486 [Orobanche minor]
MGWVWKNDDDGSSNVSSANKVTEFHRSSNPIGDGQCATVKVVEAQCLTEELEPRKFIRKCKKTEQLFNVCVGRPIEMIQSNTEYMEEDVTEQMVKGSSPLELAEHQHEPLYFPVLPSYNNEATEPISSLGVRFLQAAQEMRNQFFKAVDVPHIFDNIRPPPDKKCGIPTEGRSPSEAFTGKNSDIGDDEFSGVAKDV